MRVRTKSGVSQGGSTVTSGSLTAEQADALARELDRRGIGAPAAILLDAHRPLLPLIRQGAIFLGPLLIPLLGPRRFAILRHALDDPATYERLTAGLADEPKDGPR